MSYILLEDMRFFAHHGYYGEEQKTGNYFTVDLKMEVEFGKAAESDELTDTLNYENAYNIVKTEMGVPSRLLENVAERILQTLFAQFQQLTFAEVKLSKLNPPLGGEVGKATVILRKER
jgi:7,8-dihydroneopterin aldolase/epimerase/oxygenase